MTLDFVLYARLALGRRMDDLLATLEASKLFAPKRIDLRLKDLSHEEAVLRAGESLADTCTIVVPAGKIQISWSYTPRSAGGLVWGTLRPKALDLVETKRLLTDLALVSGATYGTCDRKSICEADYEEGGATYSDSEVFYNLYWYNYFGSEYRESLRVDDHVRRNVAEVIWPPNGGLVVIGRETPELPPNPQMAKAVADRWPYFRKYRPDAHFETPIEIDYSEVRNISLPQGLLQTSVGSAVGRADDFIVAAPDHARRFHVWANQRGVSPSSEREFASVFRKYEAELRDDKGLLVATIAAYGEFIRKKMGGEWLTIKDEPVVARRWQPWTRRHVILEVLRGMENKQ